MRWLLSLFLAALLGSQIRADQGTHVFVGGNPLNRIAWPSELMPRGPFERSVAGQFLHLGLADGAVNVDGELALLPEPGTLGSTVTLGAGVADVLSLAGGGHDRLDAIVATGTFGVKRWRWQASTSQFEETTNSDPSWIDARELRVYSTNLPGVPDLVALSASR